MELLKCNLPQIKSREDKNANVTLNFVVAYVRCSSPSVFFKGAICSSDIKRLKGLLQLKIKLLDRVVSPVSSEAGEADTRLEERAERGGGVKESAGSSASLL